MMRIDRGGAGLTQTIYRLGWRWSKEEEEDEEEEDEEKDEEDEDEDEEEEDEEEEGGRKRKRSRTSPHTGLPSRLVVLNATINLWGRGDKKSTSLDKEEEKERFTFAFFSLCSDAAAIAAGREVEASTSGEMN